MKHPCHKEQLSNLKRIEGQVRGVQGMIEEGKYCVDILNQIKALKNSLITVEAKILKTHLRECIKESLEGDDQFDSKIDEIMKIMKR
ncbi:metal-sensitive transcriptional regulator [Gammaproteobacteria bacterium]|jgi:DNA-binding FrmR family transcriptional regulator|nr:metal-sensitive transcriptional regulator [Gammaproteobacteria bacterium]|tara:strand:- start:126 stop:386 length:261 start_codon:yes stop_codon:yes gene_type:complete